ncbi:hypothetical protein [Pelomonas aquatica]|jgi:hypothetical protein|uniref:Uncharacterized protein n=1 Tax=Pelomonas aquatica TaxID=431058 RepID=A0A9X4LFS9_9BURK|nr:hypothetical protein [Pelomonas aquatica]MCY4755411.1 hypothetical protein [Pelomonas aquatica]MDG0861722.1 hypothetical protein [Pelomonas aquatica]
MRALLFVALAPAPRLMIGIDPNTNLVYEGLSNFGHGLWPAPLLLRATFIREPEDWAQVPNTGALRNASVVFREDFFDPVSRIRRGRFYEPSLSAGQPALWWVHPHPTASDASKTKNGAGQVNLSLLTFVPMTRLVERLGPSPEPVVVLGAQPAVTAWSVVAVERADHDHDVVTLKARLNFGFLPELLTEAIPAAARKRVTEAVAKVVDAAHRQSGIALVDLCRAAATVVLAEMLVEQGKARDLLEKDLGEVVAALPEQAKLRRSAADIIRMLHPRGKPNEQVRLGTPPVTEADGLFALEAFAFLLRDLGWAR